MQPAIISNRVFLGIVAFGVSFGLSLVPNWDIARATLTGVITLLATYAAAFCVDKRRKSYEMLVLNSHHKRIKELEGLKSRIAQEIDQLESRRNSLYTESTKLKTQVTESRNHRDNMQRELSTFAGQKKQLESEIGILKTELHNLEKSKSELNNSYSVLTTEKRRLELNCNASRSEINQLQNQICELYDEKQEIENNLILLGRLKPQIEEKLYELRINLQELEDDVHEQNQLLIATTNQRENIAASLNYLQTNITEQQTELQQLESQVSLLQEERDLLQNQVWELLQQMETFHQDSLPYQEQAAPDNNEVDIFPFTELIEPVAPSNTPELPEEWMNFLEQLPDYEIQILKAISEQENPQALIKQIAEFNITMPQLLIDSINERANDIIGELVINPTEENPQIYPEHSSNIKQMLSIYTDLMDRPASSN